MNKILKITLISFVVVLIVGTVSFLFFYKNESGDRGLDIVTKTLPFGVSPDEDVEFTTTLTEDDGVAVSEEDFVFAPPKLFQVHNTAVAGAFSFTNETNSRTFVRYLEKGVGHIFETEIDTMDKNRISNVTRLKIHEAVWGESGKSVVIRYLDTEDGETIRSFLIKLKDSSEKPTTPGEEMEISEEQETEGVFLPENISELAVSSDSEKIFYLIDTSSSSIGTIYNLGSGKTAQIFGSEFTEWLTQWPNKNTITLTTKPSGGVAGVMYFLDVNTEDSKKILSGIDGLTTLTSPDGKKILYSESNRSGFTLNLYNVEDSTHQILPIRTLPEKCVWSNKETNTLYCSVPVSVSAGKYPDRWYKGLVSFSDKVWVVDTEKHTTKLIADPTNEAREEIDGIKLTLDPKEDFLFFVNKKDFSLWGARLTD